MKPFFIVALLSLCATGCSSKTDGDGVPEVADYHSPHDADGQPMTGMQFVERYCQDKPNNQTCLGVDKQRIFDSRHRPVNGNG